MYFVYAPKPPQIPYQNVAAVRANQRRQDGGENAQRQAGVHEGNGHRQDSSAQRCLQQMGDRLAVAMNRGHRW